MSLQIIGTGQGRTGTSSLRLALEELGFGKCYHMYVLIQEHPEEIEYFEKAEHGEQVDWDKLFTGYKSAVDFPVIRYYKDIMTKYPDAKIIHTTRDAESWYESMRKTIFWATQPSPGRMLKMMVRLPFSPMLRKQFRVLKFNGMMIRKVFGNNLNDKAKVLEVFHQWNADVLNFIPKEKLLVYDVKSGWEPLCKFMNVPVPSTPFPKVNSSEEFIGNVKSL
jgi:hypothetical protein